MIVLVCLFAFVGAVECIDTCAAVQALRARNAFRMYARYSYAERAVHVACSMHEVRVWSECIPSHSAMQRQVRRRAVSDVITHAYTDVTQCIVHVYTICVVAVAFIDICV